MKRPIPTPQLQVGVAQAHLRAPEGHPLHRELGTSDRRWNVLHARGSQIVLQSMPDGTYSTIQENSGSRRIGFNRRKFGLVSGQKMSVVEYRWLDPHRLLIELERELLAEPNVPPPTPEPSLTAGLGPLRDRLRDAVETINSIKDELGDDFDLKLNGDGYLGVVFIQSFGR